MKQLDIEFDYWVWYIKSTYEHCFRNELHIIYMQYGVTQSISTIYFLFVQFLFILSQYKLLFVDMITELDRKDRVIPNLDTDDDNNYICNTCI